MKHRLLLLVLLSTFYCAFAADAKEKSDPTDSLFCDSPAGKPINVVLTPVVIRPQPPIDPSGQHEQYSLYSFDKSYKLGSQRQFNSLPNWMPAQPTDPVEQLYAERANHDITDTARYFVNRAHALYEKVKAESRFTDVINAEAIQDLPIAVSRTIGGRDYTIIIDSIVFTPSGGYLVAYMSLEIPQHNKRLAFRGSNIRFTNKGGITGEAKLELLEDVPMLLGSQSLLTLQGGGSTYAIFDCNGFKRLGIAGSVEFSRDYLLPDAPDGQPGEGRVRGEFALEAQEWSDIIARISLTPFQVKGLTGVAFHVREATFDWSDMRNPLDFQYPVLISSGAAEDVLWQGIYIREVSITLPQQFKAKGNGNRRSFAGYNLWIDHSGFSGLVEARNLIALEEGDMGGWPFSVDSLGLSFQSSQIKSASFKGFLNLPITAEGTKVKYVALINPNDDYLFQASCTDTMDLSLWAAKAELLPSSYLDIRVADRQFLPRAVLNGKLMVDAKLGSGRTDAVSFKEIAFERLTVSTQAPYLSVGACSFGSSGAPQKLGNFPLAVQNVSIREMSTDGGQGLGLSFDLVVNLTGTSGSSFGGSTSLTVVGALNEQNGRPRWAYKRVQLDAMRINIDGGGFKLDGSLAFFREDPTYGNGFGGNVAAEFTPGLKVQATALFGNVRDMRYWYADAMASYNAGLPIFTGLSMYGFGGGAYYKVKQATGQVGNTAFQSLSGIVYTPDESTGLGIKAYVKLGSQGRPEAFNGDVSFEIRFNNNKGIDYLGFTGKGEFITPPLEINPELVKKGTTVLNRLGQGDRATQLSTQANSNGSITASLKIDYDVPNRTLHGNLTVFVSVAGGLVRGTGPHDAAGQAVIHFAPDDWYIHIGTPSQRMGVEMMRMLRTDSYLMIGKSIPEMPPLPTNVVSILNMQEYKNGRDETATFDGSGFVFGASMGVNTGDLRFMMFYGRFGAQAGFDIMLKKYTSDVRCVGNSGPLGVNGWYAKGQAYAYLEGKIGIVVDLPFYQGNYDILSIGAAAVLQAQLPNPVWLQGTVGGYYSILNGMVKGKCKFEVTIGEKCNMVGGSVLAGVKVINQTTPGAGEKEVDVFNAPQVLFNMPVDKVFELKDLDDITKSFRIRLEHCRVLDGANALVGTLEWNEEQTVVSFNAHNILPGQKELKLSVKVSFEELVNGGWVAVKKNGALVTETAENAFVTGRAPNHIPLRNVKYSYPVVNQMHLHRNESKAGYIQLVTGQPDLFVPNAQWKQVVRFTSDNGQLSETDFTYSASDNQIRFNVPQDLANATVYQYKIVNVPVGPGTAVDANVDSVITLVSTGAGNEMSVRTQEAEGSRTEYQEKDILAFHFKTSQYASFAEKLAALKLSQGWSWPISVGIHEVGVNVEGSELFDQAEITGSENAQPLIQMEAMLNNPWYVSAVRPLVYKDYPVSGITLTRQAEPLGIPPVKAIHIRQHPATIVFSPEKGGGSAAMPSVCALVYNLPYSMHQDYMDLQRKAAAHSLSSSNAWMRTIISQPFPSVYSGEYTLKVRYVLPGTQVVTDEQQITIRNP